MVGRVVEIHPTNFWIQCLVKKMPIPHILFTSNSSFPNKRIRNFGNSEARRRETVLELCDNSLQNRNDFDACQLASLQLSKKMNRKQKKGKGKSNAVFTHPLEHESHPLHNEYKGLCKVLSENKNYRNLNVPWVILRVIFSFIPFQKPTVIISVLGKSNSLRILPNKSTMPPPPRPPCHTKVPIYPINPVF